MCLFREKLLRHTTPTWPKLPTSSMYSPEAVV